MNDNHQQDRGLFTGLYNKITGVQTESTQWDGSYGNPQQHQGQHQSNYNQAQPQANYNQGQLQMHYNQAQPQSNYSQPPPAYANSNSHGAYNPSAGMAAPAGTQTHAANASSHTGGNIVVGAVVSLKHNNSGRFLSSQGINYQSGSGQQQITSNQWNVTETEKWQFLSGFNQPQANHGTPLNFDQVVRLRHLATGRYLHSHPNIHSPVSRFQEVSGYGSDNHSDDNDNWVIEKFNYSGSNECRVLDVSGAFKLKHCTTGAYLYSHERTMQVNGATHAEVACHGNGNDENNKWRVQLL